MITDSLELQRRIMRLHDGPSWRAYLAACTADYRRYEAQFSRLNEAYRRAIGKADPRIGCCDLAFLLAHNWGNPAARALLFRQDAAWVRLRARHETAVLRRDQRWAGLLPQAYHLQITSRSWVVERNVEQLTHRVATLQKDGIPVLCIEARA